MENLNNYLNLYFHFSLCCGLEALSFATLQGIPPWAKGIWLPQWSLNLWCSGLPNQPLGWGYWKQGRWPASYFAYGESIRWSVARGASCKTLSIRATWEFKACILLVFSMDPVSRPLSTIFTLNKFPERWCPPRLCAMSYAVASACQWFIRGS